MGGDEGVGIVEEAADANEERDIDTDEERSRREYEELIKGRFKQHFAADAQRMISRRLKKYKALEEKVAELEAAAARAAELEERIEQERERAVRETEERMNRQFRSMHARAEENALRGRSARPDIDVTRLTRSERALLAKRAQKGEKIHL